MTPEEIRAGGGPGGEEMDLVDAEVHAPAKRSSGNEMPLGDVRVGLPVGANVSTNQAPRQDLPDAAVATQIVRANLVPLSEALEAEADDAAGLDEATRRDLAECVRRVVRGEAALGPDLARRLLRLLEPLVGERARLPESAEESSVEQPEEPLTAREVGILKLIAGSRSNREVAEELVVSAGTVRVHVQHIIAKLGVSDRTGAVVRGIELGLIPLHPKRDEPESPDG
jgi:DNA-binding NarL/FixJ family response regulator